MADGVNERPAHGSGLRALSRGRRLRLQDLGRGALRQRREAAARHSPACGPVGRFLVVHVGDDRQADEQRGLVRVVVGQLDADRQPLDDLHEVAGGVLRRQQGEGLTGPHGEAGDAALELMPAAVHVDLAAHALADAQVGQLSLLEVGVDPDLGERADGHQALPGLDVVAGVDVAAGDHAVDLADDVAVAEVQLGLVQVALGLEELGLGLLDGRRVGNELGEDAVEVALGVLLVELLEGLLRGRVPRRRGDSRAGPRSGASCPAPGGRRRSSGRGRAAPRPGRGPWAAGREGRGRPAIA